MSQGISVDLNVPEKTGNEVSPTIPGSARSSLPDISAGQPYKVYKRRFAGLFGLFVLNVVSSMMWPWFGPIANNTSQEFGITLDQVNWLGNVVCFAYIPLVPVIPWIVSKYGVQRCCHIGGAFMLLSAWIRYAGTVRSLSSAGAYSLLIIAQSVGAIAQGIYQVLAPKYSESWFGLKGRTTATMIIAIGNPIGTAVGQLLSPFISNTRHSIFILALISTAAVPCNFLIGDKPPTPPTHSAAQTSRSISSLVLDLIGKPQTTSSGDQGEGMSFRERLDFVSIIFLFGMFAAVTSTFSILSSQTLSPYGYSYYIAGLMGATMLLAGIVGAVLSAPLFDRIFTRHLALTVKILLPILSACWLSLTWAIRSNNTGALFAIFAIIGAGTLPLLPVTLELGVELTRAADASSAILWGSVNIFTIMLVLAEPALRAGPTGSPPFNMRKAYILQGVLLWAVVLFVIPFKGEQKRRNQDESDLENQKSNDDIPRERRGQ